MQWCKHTIFVSLQHRWSSDYRTKGCRRLTGSASRLGMLYYILYLEVIFRIDTISEIQWIFISVTIYYLLVLHNYTECYYLHTSWCNAEAFTCYFKRMYRTLFLYYFPSHIMVMKPHYMFVLGSRMSCTSDPDWNSLQLAAIHEMRKSIMHLIFISVDQGSVS